MLPMDIQLTPKAERALRTQKRTAPVSFAKPIKYWDKERGLFIVTDGVASTGQESPSGTVTHTEHEADSGRLDAEAQVRTVMAKLTPEREPISVRAPLRMFDRKGLVNG